MSDKALSVKNVSIVRNGKKILDSVNINIDEGENVAIIGVNGSGKTTLINLLKGDIRPYYDETCPAEISIFGEKLWNIFELRNKMGIVSMDIQKMFNKNTKVYEVIASGFFSSMDIFKTMIVTKEMVKKVHDMSILMGIDDLLEREIENLSLGEMRRTLIARALVTDPKMLILDEPMTGLDIVMNSKFRKMFDILMDKNVNIIMITHDLTDIPKKINRIIMMKNGKVFADGDKKELLNSKNISELYEESINVENITGTYRMYLPE